MRRTGLTLGGLIQPIIGRHLLEQHASVEKGLCQHILWCVPQPTMSSFEEQEKVDRQFASSVGKQSFATIYRIKMGQYHFRCNNMQVC